jgi:hypothetical protein
VGDNSHVVFGKTFPGEKGSVSYDAIASSLVTKVCGTECLACLDKLFVNNALDVKEHDQHTPDSALNLSRLFRF